jgi:hypothetical protein
MTPIRTLLWLAVILLMFSGHFAFGCILMAYLLLVKNLR